MDHSSELILKRYRVRLHKTFTIVMYYHTPRACSTRSTRARNHAMAPCSPRPAQLQLLAHSAIARPEVQVEREKR